MLMQIDPNFFQVLTHASLCLFLPSYISTFFPVVFVSLVINIAYAICELICFPLPVL